MKVGVILLTLVLTIGVASAQLEIFGIDTDRTIELTPTPTSTTTVAGNFTTLIELLDTPAAYAGSGGDCLKVNAGATGVEFDTCAAGSGDGSYNATYALWAYNQSSPVIDWANAQGIGSTFNSTYTIWAYNQTTPAITWTQAQGFESTFNSTYELWSYNQSQPVIDWANAQGIGSTYNATYATWAYNQTTPAQNYADSIVNQTFNQSLTDLLYADILWSYNQTTPAIDYVNAQGYESTFNATYAAFEDTDTNFFELIGGWITNLTTEGINTTNVETTEDVISRGKLISGTVNQSGGSWVHPTAGFTFRGYTTTNNLFRVLNHNGDTVMRVDGTNEITQFGGTMGLTNIAGSTNILDLEENGGGGALIEAVQNLTLSSGADPDLIILDDNARAEDNVTFNDRACFNDDCSVNIYYNGSRLIFTG